MTAPVSQHLQPCRRSWYLNAHLATKSLKQLYCAGKTLAGYLSILFYPPLLDWSQILSLAKFSIRRILASHGSLPDMDTGLSLRISSVPEKCTSILRRHGGGRRGGVVQAHSSRSRLLCNIKVRRVRIFLSDLYLIFLLPISRTKVSRRVIYNKMAAPSSPDWSDLPSDHNLGKFAAELPAILKDADYSEMYGVKLECAGER